MNRARRPAVAVTRCETCDRIADFGGISCRTCHEAACEAFGLDPRTGGPICLPGETEWQARLRRAGVRIDTEE